VSIFPTKVLLATDGSGDAELAATTAASLAKSTGSELHVVHVWRPMPSVHFDALTAAFISTEPRPGNRSAQTTQRHQLE
jgi:nucleotide-binding universal stress UspA family protein